jgi:hypothetical protein
MITIYSAHYGKDINVYKGDDVIKTTSSKLSEILEELAEKYSLSNLSIIASNGCTTWKNEFIKELDMEHSERTYCVFQSCDDNELNRFVDRICRDVQEGIDYYSRRGEVLFIPDLNEKENMPENIIFFDSDKLTVADIEWLRSNQDRYGTPIAECIQRDADNGNLGVTKGIVATVSDDWVSVHPFIVELRHVY